MKRKGEKVKLKRKRKNDSFVYVSCPNKVIFYNRPCSIGVTFLNESERKKISRVNILLDLESKKNKLW